MNYVYIGQCPFCHAPVFKDISRCHAFSWLFPSIKRTCACFDIIRSQIDLAIITNTSGVLPLTLGRGVIRDE